MFGFQNAITTVFYLMFFVTLYVNITRYRLARGSSTLSDNDFWNPTHVIRDQCPIFSCCFASKKSVLDEEENEEEEVKGSQIGARINQLFKVLLEISNKTSHVYYMLFIPIYDESILGLLIFCIVAPILISIIKSLNNKEITCC